MAIGADAPDVKAGDLIVLVEGNEDDGVITALRAKNFDDFAMVLDGAVVRGDGVDDLVEENNG